MRTAVRRLMLRSSVAMVLLTPLLCQDPRGAQAPVAAPTLADELTRVVDLPDAKARRAAALELAQKKDVPLENWLAACRGFGSFAPLEPGVHHEDAMLRVLDRDELTPIAFFVPKQYDPKQPAPLLLAMHGTGGNGRQEYLMWQSVAETLGMLIVAPSETGKNEGYAFTERERQVALLAIRWLRRKCNVDENRIYCSGESRGGHMTWDLALRHPDLFAALAPMIGGPMINPAGGFNNLRYFEGIAHLPIRDLQGSKDDPGLVFNVREGFAKLKALAAPDAQLIEFADLGHSFRFEAVDWPAWLGKAQRNPIPERTVVAFARAGEARSRWLDITRYGKDVQENFTPRLAQKDLDALNAKSEPDRKRWWQSECDRRTGRIVAAQTGPGRFTVEGTGALALRLLLDERMFEPKKPIEVRWQGKTVKAPPQTSARVLLLEFVERFDRTFLPVVEIGLP